MPAVSVLVPCYNVEKYLRQCLDSVVNQTLKDMEIICINDGSTDSTPEVLHEYAARDSRILVIDKSNSGYGDSMNKALEAATGEYIGIVESDDWADPDMFEILCDAAKKYDVDMVKSNFYDYKGGESTLNEIIPPLDAGKILCPREHTDIFKSASFIWTAIYRRDWLNRHRIRFLSTPGASYQDTSFNFKTLARAEKAFFIRNAYLHYRRDNENSSVKSSAKIWSVCDEYHEIEQFIASEKIFESLIPVCILMKYQSYYWNFRRLAIPEDTKFCLKAADEFQNDFKEKKVQTSLFKPKHYRRLKRWAFHPAWFMFTELLSRNGRRKLIQYLQKGKRHE